VDARARQPGLIQRFADRRGIATEEARQLHLPIADGRHGRECAVEVARDVWAQHVELYAYFEAMPLHKALGCKGRRPGREGGGGSDEAASADRAERSPW
jgi:hypothetical protein